MKKSKLPKAWQWVSSIDLDVIESGLQTGKRCQDHVYRRVVCSVIYKDFRKLFDADDILEPLYEDMFAEAVANQEGLLYG